MYNGFTCHNGVIEITRAREIMSSIQLREKNINLRVFFEQIEVKRSFEPHSWFLNTHYGNYVDIIFKSFFDPSELSL